MRRLRPEHPLTLGKPLHRALCVLLCVVLVFSGGLGAAVAVAADLGCATAQTCCCGEPAACPDACACEVPSTPPAPLAPLVAAPSLVDLATPPDTEPSTLALEPPPAPRAWHTTVASHALPGRALHVAHCVFLC